MGQTSNILFVLGCILYAASLHANTQTKLMKLFTHKKWLAGIVAIVLCHVFIYFQDDESKERKEHLINSLQKAQVAFLIALFAYVDLTMAPFWTVFTISYLFHT